MTTLTNSQTEQPALAPAQPQRPAYVLTLSCPDRIGIVADVSRFLVEHQCNILESAQFGDPANGRFFMRTGFQSTAGIGLDALETGFQPIVRRHQMEARLYDRAAPVRTLVLVSRFGHCLND